jgi:competence protein ComEC
LRVIGISCAWILGIWFGIQFRIPAFWICSALLPVPFLFILKKSRKITLFLILILFFFFTGAAFSPLIFNYSNSSAVYNNMGKVNYSAVVSVPPDKLDNKSNIVLSIRTINGKNVNGKALYIDYNRTGLTYGDLIEGQGYFTKPQSINDFDYSAYLASKDIYSIIDDNYFCVVKHKAGSPFMDFIFNAREQLSLSLSRALPEPQASFCQGIILGERGNISNELNTALSVTGTTHLLAISGVNLTIIAGLLLSLCLFAFGRRHNIYAWITLVIIWFYSILTGFQAPVVRSAIMASLFIIAELLGRQKNTLPALILSAAVMTGFSPRIIYNLSFQLSFLAMIGIILIAPVFMNSVRKVVFSTLGQTGLGVKLIVLLTDNFSISLGAVIAVWPLVAYNFGIISLIGPITTFLMEPALAPIIIFGSLTAITGLVSSGLSHVLGWITWLFLSYLIVLASLAASIPGIYIKSKPVYLVVWTYYIVFLVLACIKTVSIKFNAKIFWTMLWDWSDSFGSKLSKHVKWIIPPLLIFSALTSIAAVTLPDKSLRVNFLDVGEGNSVLIQNQYQNVLIIGNSDAQGLCLELGKRLPFWEKSIDLIIPTDFQSDHLYGLYEVIDRYKVENILFPSVYSSQFAQGELMQLIKDRNIAYVCAQSRQNLGLKNGVTLNVLYPYYEEATLNSEQNTPVIRLSYGSKSILLAAGITSSVETRLLRQRSVKHSSILELSNDGTDFENSNLFISTINPDIIIISGKAENYSKKTNNTFDNQTYSNDIKYIYRTYTDGTIIFILDENNMRVITEH